MLSEKRKKSIISSLKHDMTNCIKGLHCPLMKSGAVSSKIDWLYRYGHINQEELKELTDMFMEAIKTLKYFE